MVSILRHVNRAIIAVFVLELFAGNLLLEGVYAALVSDEEFA
jgi:hypothetical protein